MCNRPSYALRNRLLADRVVVDFRCDGKNLGFRGNAKSASALTAMRGDQARHCSSVTRKVNLAIFD